jgi:replicative DNA helicase
VNVGERIPPHTPDLEMALLGAMLQDDGAAATAAANLTPEDFFRDTHRLIFLAAIRCLHRGIRPDVHTVGEELERQGKLQEVGGATLVQIVEAVPTAANVAHHARIVREKAERRRIIQAAERIAAEGYADQEPLDEYRAYAEGLLFQASQAGRTDEILSPKQVVATLDDAPAGPGLSVGLPLWDQPIPLLSPGRLVILAGRPGIGKTAMACGIIARHALATPPLRCFFLSLEQTAREIAERLLAIASGRSLHSVQTEAVPAALLERLASSGLSLCEAGAPTLGTALSSIRAERSAHGIELVVLDHVGKVTGGRKETRTLEVGDVVRGLKAVAKDLRIPVLALCQLNRLVESRNVKRPQLSDLRESGEIEQEADAVVFLWTPEETMNAAQLPVRLTLAKNRHGAPGEARMIFDRPRLRFTEDAGDEDGQPVRDRRRYPEGRS